MKAGVLALSRESLNRLGELAELAEDAGFDEFWIADERFFRDVYVCLAYCANRTRRIHLGPCVIDPYSRHPALTSIAIGALDELSAGRAVLGIGAGVSGFAELGIERFRPARAMREAVEVIRAMLAGEKVEHRGKVISLQGAELGFKPPRRRVPVYIAANTPSGQRVAGAVAEAAIMEGCGTVEEVKAFAREVRAGSESAGRAPQAVELVARLSTCIAKDGATARDVLRPHVARTLAAGRLRFATLQAQGIALPEEARASVAEVGYVPGEQPYLHLLPLIPDRFVDALSLAGTPEEVTARLIDLARAGIGRVVINPIAGSDTPIEDTLRLFSEVVLPRVRKALRLI